MLRCVWCVCRACLAVSLLWQVWVPNEIEAQYVLFLQALFQRITVPVGRHVGKTDEELNAVPIFEEDPSYVPGSGQMVHNFRLRDLAEIESLVSADGTLAIDGVDSENVKNVQVEPTAAMMKLAKANAKAQAKEEKAKEPRAPAPAPQPAVGADEEDKARARREARAREAQLAEEAGRKKRLDAEAAERAREAAVSSASANHHPTPSPTPALRYFAEQASGHRQHWPPGGGGGGGGGVFVVGGGGGGGGRRRFIVFT
eukprot:COSAG01_NODE_11042_length_2018_cov_1.977639_1_plen_256_part_10